MIKSFSDEFRERLWDGISGWRTSVEKKDIGGEWKLFKEARL